MSVLAGVAVVLGVGAWAAIRYHSAKAGDDIVRLVASVPVEDVDADRYRWGR